MDSLGLCRADVVSRDIGGGVAQLRAVNYPEKVDKLILFDSVCFDFWPIPELVPHQEDGAESSMAVEQFIKMMRGTMRLGVHDRTSMSNEVVDAYLEPWSSEDGKCAFFRNLRRLNKKHTLTIAEELKTPQHKTLIIWGDKDPCHESAYASKLTDAIPNAELVWITITGHWLIEEMRDEIGNHTFSFLAS